MHQVPSDPRTVVILGDFDSMPPEQVFQYLTDPELLVKWWPDEAESEQRPDGKFRYSWPTQNWVLRGELKSFEPGRHLQFTWNWDHEAPGGPKQLVDIWLETYLEGGTRMGIYHGDFISDEQGLVGRQGVAEGWIHFLMRLAGLFVGNAGE